MLCLVGVYHNINFHLLNETILENLVIIPKHNFYGRPNFVLEIPDYTKNTIYKNGDVKAS